MKGLRQWGISLMLVALTGCDRRAPIAAGTYEVAGATLRPTATSPQLASASEATEPQALATVFVNRDNAVTWLHFTDGRVSIAGHTSWSADTWPKGCPANLGSTRMEVLALWWETLAIGAVTVRDPILVRDCPPEPITLVLREAGKIGGSGTACTGAETCTPLIPASEDRRLPASMKGYELYSWHDTAKDAWIYTLITGTNRNKTWDEISAPENEIRAEGWVKITVTGTAMLRSVMGRFPEGAEVFWIGPRGSPATVELADHLALPDARTVRTLRAYVRRLDCQLYVND